MKRKYLPLRDPVVNEFVSAMRTMLGTRLKNLYLFGSHARGDAWEGSDYDYALVVDIRDPSVEELILDVSTRLLDQYDALVSAQIFDEAEWALESKLPLGRNILKEGIVL
ncbi:MAG: nucleotidyltransferase domain-containing protein [candidate division KSB1 bacterium]|nr:nucleotidyltransferase domain-containing protein [candidate division KSB1 bacterium]